jgi:hypothetical protein
MLSLSSWVVANGWHKLVKSHPHIINYGTTTLLNLPTCALKFHKKHKTKKKGIVTLALTIKKYLNINVKNIITYFSVQHVSPSISPTIICLYVYKWTDRQTHTHTQHPELHLTWIRHSFNWILSFFHFSLLIPSE